MTVYVCYFDYGEWDNCSHPVVVFWTEKEAMAWCSKNGGIYSEMVVGHEKNPR